MLTKINLLIYVKYVKAAYSRARERGRIGWVRFYAITTLPNSLLTQTPQIVFVNFNPDFKFDINNSTHGE
jgi:hypothetical protein